MTEKEWCGAHRAAKHQQLSPSSTHLTEGSNSLVKGDGSVSLNYTAYISVFNVTEFLLELTGFMTPGSPNQE